LEAEGLVTVVVTPMPYWAERIGCPRALAVEFPFGQTMGPAGDAVRHLRVLRAALALVETANEPGIVVHAAERWPYPLAATVAAWQPVEPSPIVAHMLPRLRALLKAGRSRRDRGAGR
jgi:hypothetical protein